MSDVIAELRALYEAGTKGEWFSVGDGRMEIVADADTQPDCEKDGTCVLLDPHRSLGAKQATRDADLIVAMHRHLPALLAVVEAARKVSDEYNKERNARGSVCPFLAAIECDLADALIPTERTSE